MIKISKMGKSKNGKEELVEYEYNSINKACQENGATSGMNRNAGLKFLEKSGFDLSTLKETKTTKRKTATLIEKLIKMCTEIDKEEIKKLEKERLEIVKNATTAKQMEKVVGLNDKIAKLNNPKVDLKTVQSKVQTLWIDYHHIDDIEKAEELATEENKKIDKATKKTKK